jgi:hypothetical protein
LLKQEIIELDYAVAEGEAFFVYSVGDLAHDGRWKKEEFLTEEG